MLHPLTDVPVYSTEVKDEKLVAFHNSLTNATVTDHILQLPDGVSFLGDENLGNKLLIRQCYRDLQEIIFDGAKIGTLKKIVVTGTPGIGKSVFNFYLLYLLRLQGKTVLFNLKDIWYRFSDEGAERVGNPKNYFLDENGWFLCDPENKPTGSFRGITVVTVSPEEERTKEFLKMADSIKLFMSPWSLEELKMCRKLQYPEVSEKEVEVAFDLIGGVARPIFNRNKLEGYLEDMSFKAGRISDEELRLIQRSGISGNFLVKISDKLVHTFPVPRSGCTKCTLDYASEKAEALITWIQNMKDVDKLIGEVLSAKRSGVTGSELGHRFERVADAFLQFPVYKPEKSNEPFRFPRVVRGGGGEIDTVQFRFKVHSRVWGMNSFPPILQNDTYYKPVDPNFPDIDAFGVIDGVLYLFQMKISKADIKVPPVFKDKLWTSFKDVAGKENGIDKWVFVYVVPFYPGGIKVLNHEAHFENVVEKWRKETSSGLKSVFRDVWTIGVTLEEGKIDV